MEEENVMNYDDLFSTISQIKSKNSKSKPYKGMGTLASEMVSAYRGENTGFGQSKYDKGMNWDVSVDDSDISGSINEYRAQNQGWGAQLGLMAGRATTKALTEVGKLPGVVGGIIAAPFAKEGERMDVAFNNPWIRAMEGLQDKINTDLMPVYTAKAVKEGNLWDNISSTSFWATDGADGIGFIAAMFVPGAIFEYAGLGGKLIKGLSNSKKLADLTAMSGKAEKAVSALKSMGITGKTIDGALAVTGNTIFEAGAEAKGVGDDLDSKKPQFIKNYLNSKEHQVNSIKRLAELDNQRRSGQISVEDYNKLSSTVSQDLAEEKFKEQRALAMKDTFISNVGILLGPNAMMHKAIWGKAGKKFLATSEKEGFKAVAERAGKSAGRVGKAFASEGFFEEGSQTTVENMYVGKAMEGSLGRDGWKSFIDGNRIGDFTNEYANTLATTEGQKAIFLGGALGGPMMSYQGRKADVKNVEQTNSVLRGVQEQITNFNTVFDNNIYKKDANGNFVYKKDKEGNDTTERLLDNKEVRKVAKSLNFTEQQSELFDMAVQTGNTEVVESLKQQAIFNMILPAIHNGELGIQALEQKLKEDIKFNEIVEKDKTSDEKDKSTQFIKETLETAKYLQKQNEKFQDFSKDVIELKNDKATDKQKQEFLERLNASYLNTKHQLKKDEKSLEELEEKRNNLFDELGIDPLYDSESEFPTAKMKNGIVSDEDLEKRASKTKEALESDNPLLKKVQNDYSEVKNRIDKAKKDIADIWQGKLIDKSFDDFIEDDNNLTEETSDEKVQETEGIINSIKAAKTIDELDKIKTNEYTSEQFNKKREELEKANIEGRNEELNQEKIAKQEDENLTDKQNYYIDDFGEMVYYDTGEKSKIIEESNTETVIENTETGEVIVLQHENENTGQGSANDVDFEDPNPIKKGLSTTDAKTPGVGSKEYKDYLLERRDKTGDVVGFELNLDGLNEATKKAVELYKAGKIEENRDFLINNLPISFVYPNNSRSFSAFPNKHPSSLIIRTKIINLLQEGYKLEDLSTVVSNQENANFNNKKEGEKPAVNNVLELKELKDSKNPLAETVLYHVDKKGNFIVVSNNEEDFRGKHNVNSNLSGEIFIILKHPKGDNIPAKLNSNKLNVHQAEGLSLIYKELLNNSDLRNETLEYITDEDFQNSISKLLENEIKLLGGNKNKITFNQIIELLVLESSSSNKSIEINTNGSLPFIEFNNKQFFIEDISAFAKELVENKKQNIITISKIETNISDINFKNEDYLKYLFDNKIVSTDINTNPSEDSFKVTSKGFEIGSELWLRPQIDVNNKISDIETDEESIERKRKETESKIKRRDLFIGVGDFSYELGGSDVAAVPISHKEVNGIEFIEYAHPKTGSIDVVVTGKSGNDFVGFYRLYENGKPTNKWSSKFENKSRNKEDFKTMISGVQKMLPQGHEYTEKSSISTDGLRIWGQQLSRGYELQYDENGKLITNLVAINGDAIINELGIDVNKGNFENIAVKTKEEFEIVKKALLPYLGELGLTESDIKWYSGTVKINLPILKSNKIKINLKEIKEKTSKIDAELSEALKTNEQKVAEYRAAEKVENSEIEKRKQKELEGYSVQTRMIDAAFQANAREFLSKSSASKTEYIYPKEITHDGVVYKLGPIINDHFTVTNTKTGFETKHTYAAIYNVTNPKSTQYKNRQEELDKELAKVEKQYKKELDAVYDKYDKLITPLLNNSKNIRNTEKKSVSLPVDLKIENEMEISSTNDNIEYKEALAKIIKENKVTVEIQNAIDKLEAIERSLSNVNLKGVFLEKALANKKIYEQQLKDNVEKLNKKC